MVLSVIVPAFNEEAALEKTLAAINESRARLRQESELIVVDNASTDRSASIAAGAGARVVAAPVRGVARARNRGAEQARGDVLVFIDADTLVLLDFFPVVEQALRDPQCLGGAADTLYTPRRTSVRIYLQMWRWIGMLGGMAQGAAQFVRREAFKTLDGYDESLWMGEDVDFYWRLNKLAKRSGGRVTFLSEVRVRPSPRRFDRWPLWRILLWTNPLFILLFRRRKSAWKSWYEDPIR